MKEEWKKVKAIEYCVDVRDGTHDTPKQTEFGYKLVTAKCINNGFITPEDSYYISEKDYQKINERSKVDKWDVVMSMIGNGLGKSAVVKEEPNYAIKNLALFKLGDENKAKWLHYYLSSSIGQGIIYNTLQGSGQPFISLNYLRNFLIPNPPEEKLNKMVTILSAYDDLIENNRKQIKLLEEAAQKLYKEWFVKLNFPGHENTKIVDGVPEGWKTVKAEDYFEITIGKTPPRKEPKWFSEEKGIKWVSIADMGNSGTYILNTSEYLTEEAIKTHSVKVIPANTVLLSFKLTVGRVSITSEEMTTNEAIAHFVTDKDYVNEYLYLYLKNYNYNSLGSTSAISTAINSKIVKAMPLLIPEENILKTFSSITKSLFNKIKICQFEIQNCQSARDKLLPKLMNGELEV